ncbi:MAG TPA: peptide ABC transporter substrate-binding protein [Polyangiaceae bacterium]|jgi:oligopeptide transport system substrate-binding protein|nr:peptide ABC transporter substrate-binding protein [Polyangiaceae bacterium]
MDRTLLGIFTALGGALLLVGLTFSRSVDAPADLRFNNGTEPKTLDPHLMTGQPEHRLASALFEGLVRRDAKSMRPAPGVAKSWDVSPDGKRYTFHLRDDARWSDGHPVTASDFVYSWKRLLDPKIASEYAYIISQVRYAEALNTYDGHAESLETAMAKALAALAAANQSGVPGKEWQKFLSKNRVNDPLRGQNDPTLNELLVRRDGVVTRAELEWMQGATKGIAGDLRRQAAEARAHFGVDGGIIAVDPHTLVVELRAPTPYFMELLTFYPTMPVPRWLVENPKRRDDWFLPEHIVANGPYVLKRWLVNDHMRLERSETYWGKEQVKSRAVDVLVSDNDTTVLNMYLTHAIDWDPEQYPRELGKELRRRDDFVLTPGMIVYFYKINTTRPPFDDRRVRKALNLAIDRKAIVERILGLGQIVAKTFVPPGIPGYVPPASAVETNPEAARALLAAAGFPGGKGFPEVGILYNTNQGHKTIAEYVADQLRKNLGIKANAYNQEWQSYLETVRSLDYDIARAGWVGDYADPNTFLDILVTNGGNNQTGWSSSLYDRLVQSAADVGPVVANPESLLAELQNGDAVRTLVNAVRNAASPTDGLAAQAKLRMQLLQEAEGVLVRDEFPIIPLYFYVTANFVSPKLRGFYTTLHFDDGTTGPNLMDDHPLRDIWVDHEASP